MKICSVSNFRSLHVRNRAHLIASMGHQVQAWSLDPYRKDPRLMEHTVPFHPISIKIFRWLSRPLQLWRFARALRDTHADIYHLQYAAQMECWLAFVAGARPLVVSTMGGDVLFDEQGALGALEKSLTRMVLRSADLVTSKSDLITRRLVEMGVDPNRIIRLTWGVDLDVFKPVDSSRLRRRYGLTTDDLVVFSPRSLSPFYNTHLLVEAFPGVVSKVPRARLLIATHGENAAYRKDLESQIERLGLSGSVRFTGDIPYEDMPVHYALADVCVSLAPSDGLPMSVIEAMACGCTNVLSDLDRYRELATDDREAVFVELNTEKLSAALCLLLKSPDTRRFLGTNARAAVEDKANLRRDLERLEKVLRELGAGGNGSGGRWLTLPARLLFAMKVAKDIALPRLSPANTRLS